MLNSYSFLPYTFYISKFSTNLFGRDCEVNGIYLLSKFTVSIPLLSCIINSTQWHYFLGHAPLSLFHHIGIQSSHSSVLKCESCQLGKYHRVSFLIHVNIFCSYLFYLIHLDTWDSIQISNFFGFKYFITFIDGYYRATQAYLLKEIS